MTKGETPEPDTLSPVKRALHTIGRLQARIESLERSSSEPIAIVGIGCRFPGGVNGPDAFWRLLCEGRDAIAEVPADRFDLSELYDADPEAPGKMYMRHGGFLERVDGFDAPFFRISPREASQMDPQQRLFLEVAWEALENAGQPAEALAGSRTGVFAGVLSSDYAHLPGPLSDRIDAYYYPGINGSFVAGRLSYFLGSHGPSLTVDTACSSSLVAVHLACQSLRGRESDLALAGGVNLILSPEISIFLCKVRAMSPTGRCRAFDKDADGMVRGEGCGIVVLKRLKDAVEAGDEVIAVIRGSATNHDGASGGLTVPNPQAQESLYRAAMRSARVSPVDVSYVEAHGTGTSLGDPVELAGLSAAYCQGRSADRTLWIGSVKTNIGHTDSAAGVANLIKTALILKHGEIPPTLHFKEPNPQFAWDVVPISVARRRIPLPQRSSPQLAGVSAFGLSGVNAHVILEQATAIEPAPGAQQNDLRSWLLPVSAKTPPALREAAAAFREVLARPERSPREICSAAALRRSHLEHRVAVVGRTREELSAGLQTFLGGEFSPAVAVGHADPGRSDRIVFVFSGQGPQWWAMGRELLERSSVFRGALDRIEELFSRESGWSLLEELRADERHSRIHETQVAQPAMFAVQVALVELWKSWGVVPHAVVGHSMGEVAAAHVAGVLTLEDAVRVIHHRGRLLEKATGLGKMAAVGLGFEAGAARIEPYAGSIAIAAHNGPSSVVLSGEGVALDRLFASLDEAGTFYRELHVKFASHCPQMDAYQAELAAVLHGIKPGPPALPIVSTVTGAPAGSTDFDPAYWARNIREPVRFATAMDRLIEEGYGLFLEIDPHPVLAGSISDCLEARGRSGIALKSLHREEPDDQALLESLAALHVHGFPIDFRLLYPGRSRHVALPSYPWQRRRYWLKSGAKATAPPGSSQAHPLLGERVPSPLGDVQFHSSVKASDPEYLEGHRIAGRVVFPASIYGILGLAAAEAVATHPASVTHLAISVPLFLTERRSAVQVVLSPPDDAGERVFRVFGSDATAVDGPWTLHATGSIVGETAGAGLTWDSLDVEAIKRRCEERSADAFYRDIEARGYQYQGAFRGIETLWKGSGEVLSRVRLPEAFSTEPSGSIVHPALLDACMHSVLAALEFSGEETVFVPTGVERLRVVASPPEAVWAHGTLRRPSGQGGSGVTADLRVFDTTGRPILEVQGLALERAAGWSRSTGAHADAEGWCYEVTWQPGASEGDSPGAGPDGSWIVFTDGGLIGASVLRALEAKGRDVVQVRTGENYEGSRASDFTLDPKDPGHFRRLFRDLRASGVSCGVLVFLWATDRPVSEATSPVSIRTGQDVLCGGALHLVQAVEQADLDAVPRLWFITQRCQSTGDDGPPSDPAPATLWGLARVIRLEHPGLRCACLDLDATGGGDQSGMIVREIESSGAENEVAFRRGVRHVARLRRHALVPRAAGTDAKTVAPAPARVMISACGILENLALAPALRRPPGPGEVEIRVRATGLNFRDALNALGMLGQDTQPLGIGAHAEILFGHECAGQVVAVGKDVQKVEVGDEVIAGMASGSLGTFVTVRSEFVVPRPAGMTPERAATLPVAFLTAYYGLHDLARIERGERVLIHCAAGGVGQAAVQLARRAGARVFATASPGKWDFVRASGAELVLSSRSPEFGGALMEATSGQGVDVVLNSLGGEFIARSLEVCAPRGRFVELGRIGILDEREARRRRPDVSYFPLALPEVAEQAPGRIASILQETMRLIEEGALEPLPLNVYPMGEVVDAFRSLAQARHIGKVVVSQEIRGSAAGKDMVRSDGTYLITGGLGALGLRVARWLADAGARHLVLMGRRGAAGVAADEVLALERDGVRVLAACGDVSDPADVARVLEQAGASMPPLRGVVHAAAVLEDGVLVQQSLERFRRVLDPKVNGAWNLHLATQDTPLDFFVCFSSTVAMLGSPGQGSYAAANAFLDALAQHRRSRGLPGTSINWGPWADTGMAADLSDRDRARWAARGVAPIPPERGLDLLGRLLRDDAAQVAVLPVDWSRFLDQLPAPSAFFEAVSPAVRAAPAEPQGLRRRLESAPPGEGRSLLEAHVRSLVGKVLGLASPENIGPRQRLFDLGLDSLMAVELKNRLSLSLGQSLRSTLVFDYPTVEALVGHLAGSVLPPAPGREPAPEPAQPALDGLSEDELAELLARELSDSNQAGSRER